MNQAISALERRILAGIPLSRAMAFRIAMLEDTRIRVEAPLAPNVNVHGSGFAGSLYALGILTAWAICAHLIERAGLDAELVVAGASIAYRDPVQSDVHCRCDVAGAAAQGFVERLMAGGRSRLEVTVEIGDGPAATLDATMHARMSGAGR